MRYLGLFILMCLFGIAPQCWADDTQTRTGISLKLIDTEKVDFSTYFELRSSDSGPNPKQYTFSERVALDLWPHLALGLNYTHIEKNEYDTRQQHDTLKYTHRVEFEINPHCDLGEHVVFQLRNRLEYRWLEDRPNNIRTRHRAEFLFPLQHTSPLTGVFTSAEFFYDYDLNRNSENRVIPLGLNFRLNRHMSLKTYYLWDVVHSGHSWTGSRVLFTQLYISLN